MCFGKGRVAGNGGAAVLKRPLKQWVSSAARAATAASAGASALGMQLGQGQGAVAVKAGCQRGTLSRGFVAIAERLAEQPHLHDSGGRASCGS